MDTFLYLSSLFFTLRYFHPVCIYGNDGFQSDHIIRNSFLYSYRPSSLSLIYVTYEYISSRFEMYNDICTSPQYAIQTRGWEHIYLVA
jgi:hypothetical protein